MPNIRRLLSPFRIHVNGVTTHGVIGGNALRRDDIKHRFRLYQANTTIWRYSDYFSAVAS